MQRFRKIGRAFRWPPSESLRLRRLGVVSVGPAVVLGGDSRDPAAGARSRPARVGKSHPAGSEVLARRRSGLSMARWFECKPYDLLFGGAARRWLRPGKERMNALDLLRPLTTFRT